MFFFQLTLKDYLIKDGNGQIFSKEVLKLYSEEIFKYFNILEKFILTSTKELLHISKNKVT